MDRKSIIKRIVETSRSEDKWLTLARELFAFGVQEQDLAQCFINAKGNPCNAIPSPELIKLQNYMRDLRLGLHPNKTK